MDYLLEICLRLAAALVVGALIGVERSYRGRPAGFRTHTLVCLASSLLMLVTVYESQWFAPTGSARGSSTRTVRSRRSGQMAKTAPRPTIAPPIQIQTTSGFTKRWSVTDPLAASAARRVT